LTTGAANTIGQRVRTLRDGLGMTQDELAQRVGFASRQTLSDLERGQREVKASELSRLARALNVDLGTLLAQTEPVRPQVLWREKPSVGAEDLQSEFLRWCERYAHVKRAAGACDGERLAWPTTAFDASQAQYNDAEELARQAAALLGLGSRPAASLQRALETQLGVMVWFLDLGDRGSAACAKGEFGAAILVNKQEAPWRRNFDLAHELFHLLTWESACPGVAGAAAGGRVEKLANAFAAALLLPADTVRSELRHCAREGSLTMDDLVAMARDFDVSMSALMWRLLNLGCGLDATQIKALLVNEELRRLDRASRVGKWWDPSPLPERFVWLAGLATAKGRLSRSKLADYLECGLADLDDCLAEYGVSEAEPEVVLRFMDPAQDLDTVGGGNGPAEMCIA
jgi:Zn-dependent peptidase ImmA (M78 family)/transcriptional regulator with XRE-family HTH domain